jgi:hypothetical protein
MFLSSRHEIGPAAYPLLTQQRAAAGPDAADAQQALDSACKIMVGGDGFEPPTPSV